MSKIKVDEIESQSGSTVTITGSPSISGDISVANVNASQDVTATGDVSGANLSATTDVSTGTVTATGAISGASATVTGAVSADTVSATTSVDTATVNATTGAITTVNATDVNSTDVTATGAVSGDTVSGTTSVTTATVNATTGAITTVNATDVNSTDVTATGAVSGDTISGTTSVDTATVNATTGAITTVNATDVNSTDVTATGTVSGNAVSSTTSVSADTVSATTSVDTATVNATDVTATGTVSGNALTSTTSVSGASASITGDVSAGTFTGDGSALTGVTKANQDLDTTDDVNFNSVTAVGTITANSFTGDGSALTGIGGGATVNERLALIDLVQAQALDDFNATRTETNLHGGFYEIFVNGDKIDTNTGFGESFGVNGSVRLGTIAQFSNWSYNTASITQSHPIIYEAKFDNYQGGNFIYTGDINGNMFKYELSTPYDITTINSTAVQQVNPSGAGRVENMLWLDNGKLRVSDRVDQFSWEFSTRLPDGSLDLSAGSTQSTIYPTNNSSDSSIYYVDGGNKAVQFYNTSVIVYENQNYGDRISTLYNVDFTGFMSNMGYMSDDGATMILADSSGNVNLYSLSTPYNPNTASLTDTRDFASWNSLTMDVATNYEALLFASDNLRSPLAPSGGITGTILYLSFDLSDQLSQAPDAVVLAFNGDVGGGSNTLDWEISDGTNTVTVPSTSADTEVDCSALTGTTLTVTVNGEIVGGTEITINDWALYFK